jgi:hypothetical protein
LENCAFLLNMRGWASSHETMDPTDKSKHSAKYAWDLIMHGIIPEEMAHQCAQEARVLGGRAGCRARVQLLK